MAFRGRIPMFAAASALLALIALLATLQYNWLGRISDAERERMKAMLNARAAAFAQDVDRELTRAFLTFQTEFMQPEDSIAARVALRYDRWQATARYPRMIKDVYLVTADRAPRVMHFNATTRFIEPVEWPAALKDLQAEFGRAQQVDGDRATMIVRTLPPAVIDSIPAVVVPTPILMLSARPGADAFLEGPAVAGTVLLLDREYIVNELVPALARQHFRGAGDGVDYQLAVVRPATNAVVYHSDQRFAPTASARVDTSVDLFQVRLQDFKDLVSEVRRLSTFMAMPRPQRSSRGAGTPAADPRLRGQGTIFRHTFTAPIGPGTLSQQEGAPVSIVVEERGAPPLPDKLALAAGAAASRVAAPPAPAWRLMVKHPSGSLEQAVGAVRRRNLILSSSILAILGISVGFLIITTRRAQDLARQQMEFVATVSHELRTPLAVIRSAADNLADGLIHDEPHIRRYGELVGGESRRLSDLVEQILEYAGLQSGRSPGHLPIALAPLLRDVASGAQALAASDITIEIDVPDSLPPIAGDEAALRRAFQNLIGNAVKYGAAGRWVGIHAHTAEGGVEVSVADRGIGIAAADQARIFEPFYRAPDVMAAQIQGAGLGLSLVKRIVEAHGGRISVRSAPGAGSAFIVTLPAATADAAAAADGVRAPAAPQHS